MPPSLARILDARGASRLALSPDVSTLYYVSDLAGTVQLWRVPVAGGVPVRLSYEADRVGAYRLSADGALVVYGADQGGDERWAIWVMCGDGTEARRLTDRPDRIHHVVGWTRDGAVLAFANLRDERYFDLHAFSTDGRGSRLLFRHDGTGFRATVLTEGRIVVTTNRARGDQHHLTLVESDGATRRLTPEIPAAMHGGAEAFGDGVLVRSDRDRDKAAIARVGLDGSFAYMVTPDRVVDEIEVAGPHFAYGLNVDGRTEVHLVSGGADRAVAGLPPGDLATDLIGNSLSLAADGTLAIAWACFDAPSAVYVARPGGAAKLVVPPQTAGLPADGLPEEELVSWTSFDGRSIPGFLLRPRGTPRGPRPTVIQVHGGPEGQARPLWNPLTVALVAAGFNVLQPNVRGSSGYGRAYMELDDVRLRMDSVKDLDAGAAWLSAAGIAPAGRIGVIGGSYGGFMTLAAITFCPERNWAAAVDIVGISSWASFFAKTSPWRRPLRAAEYGDPVKDADFLESISPLNFIDRIRAPLMVIHGANDPRVPVDEAEQIVATLRSRGRPVEYLRYEDEGHGLAKAKNRADAWPKVVAFFERYLSAD
ncbi:MAG TPA: S9 family peptidase [Candidatus Limnocylindria bacterium]|jgi:dipeptidyl aminopeptidase/acylaminoacyl peptidase|nr:S9 family peptidase [Candidatus Limnocylindria bacterium]